MIVGIMCKKCKEIVNVCGEAEDIIESGSAMLEQIECYNNGQYFIRLFQCPYCGENHTVGIDTKETKDILNRSMVLMAKQRETELDLADHKLEQSEGFEDHSKEIARCKKRIKELRKKGIKNDERLQLKRAELQTLARGLVFKRSDGKKDIVFDLYDFKIAQGEIS